MQLQVFNHKDLGQVRVIGDNENPLFCLRDICEVLGLESVNKVANAIKAEFEGRGELDSAPLQTKGGIQQATFITEPQLYFVLMRSDKPKAKPQWVVNEVLPSIRKNGYYINQSKKTRAKQEQILHNLITELQDSNTQKDCIKQENESLKDEVIAMQRKLLALCDNKDKKEIKILPEHYGKRLSKEEKIQILSLREQGKSIREIQEIMQRSKHALYCVLREAKRGVL